MTDEQWQSVWKLYQSSRSIPPEQLSSFLNAAVDDPEVRDEVLAMLQEPSGDSPDRIGQKIGRYVVTGHLGQGGMGEVYAARDTELGRMVAVKLLAAGGAASTAERLIQEARAASALNHPNIVTVYEVLHASSRLAIVMELVDGVSLRQLCGASLPVDRVLHIGEQVARALTAAHARAIVHCDIKPENLMMRQDGLVKVLDFGLAQDLSSDSTSSLLPVGTLRYMSPEQSRGGPASAAGDIFSLGIVLYELVAGRHPFEGGSIFGTLKALNEASPPAPSSWNAFLPPQLDALILRMLARDPSERPSAAQTAQTLEACFRSQTGGPTVATGAQPSAPLPKPRDSRRAPRGIALARWWIGALALVVLVVAIAIWWFSSSGNDVAFDAVPLTALPGSEEGPSFSPDGGQVAYRGNQEKSWDVYVKLIGGSGPPLRLTSDAGTHWYPAWSPDGKWIAFTAQHDDGRNGVFLMPALGGQEQLLAELEGDWRSADWSPDGKWIAVSPPSTTNFDRGSGVTLIAVPSGERHELLQQTPEMAGSAFGRFSPDRKRLAFLRMQGAFGQLYVADLTAGMRIAGKPRQVVPGELETQYPAWTADGRDIVFMRGFASSNGSLCRVRATGGAVRKIPGLGYSAGPIGISRSGGRMAFSRGGIDSDIWRFDTKGEEAPRKWIASTLYDVAGEFSPDGKRIAFSSNRSGSREIWVCNADGSNAVQLTHFGGPITGTARWSPDGRWIAFDSRPRGNPDLFVMSAEGSKLRRLTERPGEDEKTNRRGMFQPAWSADGKWIYFSSDASGRFEIWRMPSEGGPATQVTRNGGASAYPSRDGEWIYYVTGQSGPLRRIRPDGTGDNVAADRQIELLQYTSIPGAVYFVAASEGKPLLQRLSPNGTITNVLEIPFALGLGISVSPDGRYVLVTRPDENGTDLMLVEGFR